MPRGVYERTDEHKRKISEAMKGKSKSPEAREHMSESKEGSQLSQAHVQSISLGMRRHEAQKIQLPLATQEENVRPVSLDEFVGSENIKKELRLLLEASSKTGKNLGHTLITGLAGAGKTTLAQIIARHTNAKVVCTYANLLRKQSDLRSLLAQLSKEGFNEFGEKVGPTRKNIIIVDEIHLLKDPEMLYEPMEDFKFTVKTYDEHSGEELTHQYRLPDFCLIGISNRAGELPAPLLERFKITLRLEEYSVADMIMILRNAAVKLKIAITEDGLANIAMASKGIPRVGIGYLERCHNIQIAEDAAEINGEFVQQVFEMIGVFDQGLTKADIDILKYLYKIKPRKIGVSRLAQLVGETEKSFLNNLEPFLFKHNMMVITPGGRTLGKEGFTYLKEKQLLEKSEQGKIVMLGEDA